jgi:hypothetical protein
VSEFDPRITPARPDLAAEHLRGKVSAERYAPGESYEVVRWHTGLRRAPEVSAPLETELLAGERFTVYEKKGAYAWGQAETDGYVGYVFAHDLEPAGPEATHRVKVRQSRLYNDANSKSFALLALSLGAKLRVKRDLGRFSEVRFETDCFVPSAHIAPLAEFSSDYVAVAEMFLGVPYVWGGRTSLGLDCSALVQLSLAEAGIKSPRDSDQQREAFGKSIGGAEALSHLQRGDLVFWKNHVAIAIDKVRMIHANAMAMAVSIDEAIPFARAVEASEGPVIAVKRL